MKTVSAQNLKAPLLVWNRVVPVFFLPEKFDTDPTDPTTAKAYVNSLLFIAGLFCLMVILKTIGVYQTGVFPTKSALGLTLIILFIYKQGVPRVICSSLLLAFVFVFNFYSCIHFGGIYSRGIKWMLFFPYISFIFIGRRAGWLWSFVTLVSLFYLCYSPYNLPDEAMVYTSSPIWNNLMYFTAIVCVSLIFYNSQKKMEREIRTKNESLELEKRRSEIQSKELNKAKEALVESNIQLKQYAYRVSHDLKSPLRSILMSGYFIKKELETNGQMSETLKTELEGMKETVNNLTYMIDTVLDYSRLESIGNIPFEEVSLNDIVDDVVGSMQRELFDIQANLQVVELPVVKGIPVFLSQLFQNLISNAIKYRKEDVTLEIEIDFQGTDQYWLIRVKDNGTGIEESKLTEIFKPFVKYGNKGTGIGLATCMKIAEKHGGKIEVESVPGEGSVFVVRLPKRPDKSLFAAS